MDYIIKKASSLTSEELTALGITGIPQDWPIESYLYNNVVPNGFEQISDTDLEQLKANNQAAYDAWLQSLRPIIEASSPEPLVVQTLFEAKDKTLKLVSTCGQVDENGDITLEVKIPGILGVDDGRFLSGGMAWFSKRHDDDRVCGVYFVDIDGLLGTPGAIIGSYTEDELDEPFRGWRVPPIGHIVAETIGFYGHAPSGFYIRICGKSGDGYQEGKKLYINFEWGKVE
jgi:hypothetical protein